MDKVTQNSLINTVNSIVNPQPAGIEELQEKLAVVIAEAIDIFEDTMGIQVTEEEQQTLTELGVSHFFNPTEVKQINLNEDVQSIMENNTPEEVFLCILEGPIGSAVGGIAGSALGGAVGSAIAPGVGTVVGGAIGGAAGQWLGDKTTGESPTQGVCGPTAQSTQAEKEKASTLDPYGQMSALIAGARQRVEGDPSSQYFANYVEENFKPTHTKKKKKVFKIIYQKSGMKKKTTAVSHKGAQRIVSDKDSFRVFDEHNRDITQQFKKNSKKK